MVEKIIIAGAGGQGIMLFGRILAEAAMRQGRFVTWLPSYGAEVRGGTAHCAVVISDEEISSPYIKEADTLIIMNTPSLERFIYQLRQGGLLILNSSLVKKEPVGNFQIFKGPFTDIALKLGNARVANVVALGSYLAAKKNLPKEGILAIMKTMVAGDREELLVINKKALENGIKAFYG